MSNDPDEVRIGTFSAAMEKAAEDKAETIEATNKIDYSGARDKAGQLLKEAGHPVLVTADDNKRILRKIDVRILPILLVVYCLQYLDKGSLSYASVFGILDQAHLEGDEYSWLGAIVSQTAR